MPTQARSIASLTISFGLVAIPVKLYSATVPPSESRSICCGKRTARASSSSTSQWRTANPWNARNGQGLRIRKDQYVMFSAEELKALEDTTTTPSTSGNSFRWSRSIRCISMHVLSRARQRRREAVYAARDGAAQAGQCAVGRWVSGARSTSS